MQLIPVLDLMQGLVVRGIGGDRENYQSNTSCLVSGASPSETLLAIDEIFDPDLFYIADLDGIRFNQPQTKILMDLISLGPPVAIDLGVKSVQDAVEVKSLGADYVIVAGETLPDLSLLPAIIESVGSESIVFSVDLMNGTPLGPAIGGQSAREALRAVYDQGVENVILLDLVSVGGNSGPATISLCHWLHQQQMNLNLWTGGGIRSVTDLHALSSAGVHGVLISSALHEGRITLEDWQVFKDLSDDALRASDA